MLQRLGIRSLAIAAVGSVLLGAGAQRRDDRPHRRMTPAFKGDWHMLQTYCTKCHNSEDWAGGVAFDTMNAAWPVMMRRSGKRRLSNCAAG